MTSRGRLLCLYRSVNEPEVFRGLRSECFWVKVKREMYFDVLGSAGSVKVKLQVNVTEGGCPPSPASTFSLSYAREASALIYFFGGGFSFYQDFHNKSLLQIVSPGQGVGLRSESF